MFKEGTIKDVIVKELKLHKDQRGWLIELFRQDELPSDIFPVMSYVSETLPQICRGPHEHADQTDFFAFIGPSNFKIFLWDNRKSSPTFGNHQVFVFGSDRPASVVIPPGIVHAYKNIGSVPGLVFNAPNRLFAGVGKKDAVDEIRHENDPNSPFRIDD